MKIVKFSVKILESLELTIKTLSEPSLCFLLLDLVLEANLVGTWFALSNTVSWAGHDDVEVSTEDTNTWVVLDTQIDVLVNTETKVTSFREVALLEFVFLDLKTTFEDFLSLWTSNGNVASDLFVTTDTECTDSVTSLWGDWSLTSELFEDLGCTCKSVTRFTNGDVYKMLAGLSRVR